jgi:molybdopterin-guanine dinucleotide biosynthesis protein A
MGATVDPTTDRDAKIDRMMVAVVLAGGRARRLGGRHKPGIELAGRTLLDRALAAVSAADSIVVVGPRQTTSVPVRWTLEQPPGGGPVAAIAAGLAVVGDADEVAVLAADLVGVTADTITRLRAALAARPDADGAVLRDDVRRQWLIGVWRADALRAALPPDPADRSLHGVLSGLTITEIPALPGESADVDTPADLAAAERAHHDGAASPPSHW